MFTCGPAFFGNSSRLNAGNTGFLSNMESKSDATHVVSTYGPELVLTGSEDLVSSPVKFGANALFAPTAVQTPNTIALDLTSKGWRVEGWYNSTNTFGQLFQIAGSPSGYQITISASGPGTAWTYNITSRLVTGGGNLVGATRVAPANNDWYHFAVQQVAGSFIYFFCNGQVIGGVSGSSGTHFTGSADLNYLVLGGGMTVYFDSVVYRTLEVGDPDIYPPGDGFSTTYTVPTGPFL